MVASSNFNSERDYYSDLEVFDHLEFRVTTFFAVPLMMFQETARRFPTGRFFTFKF